MMKLNIHYLIHFFVFMAFGLVDQKSTVAGDLDGIEKCVVCGDNKEGSFRVTFRKLLSRTIDFEEPKDSVSVEVGSVELKKYDLQSPSESELPAEVQGKEKLDYYFVRGESGDVVILITSLSEQELQESDVPEGKMELRVLLRLAAKLKAKSELQTVSDNIRIQSPVEVGEESPTKNDAN